MDRYNEARPHSALDGQTPNKVYNGLRPANRRPRIEPRDRWQRRSSCAKPYALVAGKPGDNYIEEVQQLPDRMKITSTRTTFIGSEGELPLPAAHTTVRTVPYTAVQAHRCRAQS
jgi:hypothetical protein